jgi:hypothetical protein
MFGKGDVTFPPGKSLDTFANDVKEKIADVKEWNTPERRYWYENGGKSIMGVSGDPAIADRMIGSIATTSTNTPVPANAAFSIRGHNQIMAGDPVNTGMFPNAMGKKITDIYNDPASVAQGRKTGGYQDSFRTAWDPQQMN